MTDRELLEFAAKAAGLDVVNWNEQLPQDTGKCRGAWINNGCLVYWNPLTDDGDALRLAVKLQLSVCNEHVTAGAAYCTDSDDTFFEEVRSGANQQEVIDGDYTATRRAIVLAAAEIGKNIGFTPSKLWPNCATIALSTTE